MKLGLKRIFLGGLVAGLALTIGGVLSAFILGLGDTFAEQGVSLTAREGLLHTGLRFGLGFAAIFLFAGMRRGLGRTPLTALLTAVLVWYAAYVPGTAVLHQLGIYDDRQLSVGLIWGFAEMTVALLLGAWFFRDEAPSNREPMAKAPVEVAGPPAVRGGSGEAAVTDGSEGPDPDPGSADAASAGGDAGQDEVGAGDGERAGRKTRGEEAASGADPELG